MADPGAGGPRALYQPETKRVWLFVGFHSLNMTIETAEMALQALADAITNGRDDANGQS